MNLKNPFALIFQVKAAFTRAYQKNPPMLPYAINTSSTAKKRSAPDDDVIEEEEEPEEEDSIDSNKMVKVTLKATSPIVAREFHEMIKHE